MVYKMFNVSEVDVPVDDIVNDLMCQIQVANFNRVEI